MLNIKDTGFGYAKTWKSILSYDKHEYKDSRLILNSENNINLIDKKLEFEQKVKKYKATLINVNNKEKHKSKHKTSKEINSIFNNSKIIRSFRIAANHIELETLHKSTDNEEQRKQNIINFYKDCLDQFKDILKNNYCKKNYVDIIQADIHFDQSIPHLHLHVSNLYERHFKTIKENGITCNYKLSDAIRILNDERKANNYNLKLNDLFANKLAEKNQNYLMINFLDLKKQFPKIYDVFKYKNQKIINMNNLSEAQKWRLDKELQFEMTKKYLKSMKLNIDYQNEIVNQRKINDVTLYTFMNALKMSYSKTKNLSIAEIWDNKSLLKELIDYHKEINILKLEPKSLINENSYILEDCNIGSEFEHLKSIEDEMLNCLQLLQQEELDQNFTKKNWISKGFDIDGTLKEEYYSKLRLTEQEKQELQKEYINNKLKSI